MYTAPKLVASLDAALVLSEALGAPECPSFFPTCKD